MTAPATVESQIDPRSPGRVAYRVTSLYSAEAVQRAVADLMNAEGVSRAQFTHVERVRGEGIAAHWCALGEVFMSQEFTVMERPDDDDVRVREKRPSLVRS